MMEGLAALDWRLSEFISCDKKALELDRGDSYIYFKPEFFNFFFKISFNEKKTQQKMGRNSTEFQKYLKKQLLINYMSYS